MRTVFFGAALVLSYERHFSTTAGLGRAVKIQCDATAGIGHVVVAKTFHSSQLSYAA